MPGGSGAGIKGLSGSRHYRGRDGVTASGIFRCACTFSRKSRSVSGTNAKAGGQRPAVRGLDCTGHRFLQQRFHSAPALAGRFGVQSPATRVLADVQRQIRTIHIPLGMNATGTIVPAQAQRFLHHRPAVTALRKPGGLGGERDHRATGPFSLATQMTHEFPRGPVADAPAEHPLKGLVAQLFGPDGGSLRPPPG